MPDFADLIYKIKTGWRPKHVRDPRREPPAPKAVTYSTLEWQTTQSRATIDVRNHAGQYVTWGWLKEQLVNPKSGRVRDPAAVKALGLCLGNDAPSTIYRSAVDDLPSLEVHSVRSARRQDQEGQTKVYLVIELTQRRRGYIDPAKQARAERLPPTSAKWKDPAWKPDFKFRGGCTLLIDSETGDVVYCVKKDIMSEARMNRQRSFAAGAEQLSLRATYSSAAPGVRLAEPFAMLHRGR
jgi:hypothetical protein